ncbi:zf-HC2 domain-containing protein [Gleimia sp. 6138-11-ORH1]|uniref:zf-HC2 domain-containing protein n=1 Tax=Gleimia sp. 6138-11-ORH1 TaxID=2973937 RepID=UPI0037C07DF6
MGYLSTCTTCEELEELLFLLADGELDAQTQERLQVHLSECAHCKTLFDVEVHLRALLKDCYRKEVPADLEAQIRNQIRTVEVKRD